MLPIFGQYSISTVIHIDFAKNVVSFRVHIYSLQNILSRTVTPIIYGFMRVGPVYLEFGLVFNPVCPADHIMEID